MKKNSLIVCFIVILILTLIVVINVIDINNKSTLTCIRENKDKVVFKVDDYKITSIILNGKKMSREQIINYCSLEGAKCYHFSYSSLSNKKSNVENREEFLDEIKNFEEYYSEFYSKCHIGK